MKVMEHLRERKIEFKDYGTYSKESCDYPVLLKKVAKAVASGKQNAGY